MKNDNEETIEKLNQSEQRIVKLLEIASQTCQCLAAVDTQQEESLKQLIAEFFQLVKEIQNSLNDQLKYLIDNNPYMCSISNYGAKKDLEIATLKTELLSQQITFHKQNADSDHGTASVFIGTDNNDKSFPSGCGNDETTIGPL
jgi:ABC-type transporter Mla subunit MlaD